MTGGCRLTDAVLQGPDGQEEEVDGVLLAGEFGADIIHVAHQGAFPLEEDKSAFGVERFTFGRDAVAGFLRAPDNVDAWLSCVFRELLHCRFADSIGAADEHGDKAGQSRTYAIVGGLYDLERDHAVCRDIAVMQGRVT